MPFYLYSSRAMKIPTSNGLEGLAFPSIVSYLKTVNGNCLKSPDHLLF